MTEPTTASLAALYEALAKAQGAMSPAPKDGHNSFLNAGYSSFASIVGAARTALAANGLSVSQSPCFDAERNMVEVETTLMHASGVAVQNLLFLPVVKQPKRGETVAAPITAQDIAATITAARKIGFASLVGVVSEGDDAEASQASPPKQQDPERSPRFLSGPAEAKELERFSAALAKASAVDVLRDLKSKVQASQLSPDKRKQLVTAITEKALAMKAESAAQAKAVTDFATGEAVTP